MALVAPLLHEEAGVEVGAPLALVVDEVAVGEQGPVVGVEGRDVAEGQVVHEHRDRVGGVVRAAAEVDDLRVGHDGLHALAFGGTVLHEPAIPRAGADREGERGVAGHLADDVHGRAAADRAVRTVGAGRDRALDDGDVLPLLLAHGLAAQRLGLRAGGGHDQLVVVPGQRLEHELGHVGVRGAQDRLGVAPAVLELAPDEDRTADRRERLGDAGPVARGERQRRGHHATEAHEAAPADAALGQPLLQGRVCGRQLPAVLGHARS